MKQFRAVTFIEKLGESTVFYGKQGALPAITPFCAHADYSNLANIEFQLVLGFQFHSLISDCANGGTQLLAKSNIRF